MSPVDKSICLKLFKAGLSPKPWAPFPEDKKVHEGPAKYWENASEPSFQRLLEKSCLSLDSYVTIWDQGPCSDGGRIYRIIY